MANLAALPAELLNDIVQPCSHTDIKHLSETCRLLHNKMLPELFRNLDLSTHNATVRCRSKLYTPWGSCYSSVPANFIAREWHPLDGGIARKQGLLMRTIADKPHYGKYVRELHWTALDSFQNMLCRERPLAAQPRYCDSVFVKATSWDWDVPRAMFTPTEKLDLMRKASHDSCEDEKTWDNAYKGCVGMERDSFPPEDEPIWRIFYSFVHVLSIDLCWLRPWREAIPPALLFQTANSIRLSGRMTQNLVVSILGDLSTPGPRLHNLEMNDLKLWAELEPVPKHQWKSSNLGRDLQVPHGVEVELAPPAPAPDHLQELSRYYDANRTKLQMQSNEQVTAETLSTLANRCFALTALRITITGPNSLKRPHARDELLYDSWARLLKSVSNTLCDLYFEQCEGTFLQTSSAPNRVSEQWQTDRLRPMEWLFARHILPVLLDAPWSHMRCMEIRGAGLSEHAPPTYPRSNEGTPNGFPLEAEEKLRDLLGCEAELIIGKSTQEREHVDPVDAGIPPAFSQWEAWKAVIEQREHHHDETDRKTVPLASCRIGNLEQNMVRGRHCTLGHYPRSTHSDWYSTCLVPRVKYVGPKFEGI